MAQTTTIIPVAGGKGGVGKTFVAANLAAALAKRGHSTIVVDLDLGNSNLHTLLGIENRHPGVGEFLHKATDQSLANLVVPTEIPNLRFLPGDGRLPFMANITYYQKRTLLRAIGELPANYVVLDLSAGTSFNTLDLFLIRDKGIVVTSPEYPAIHKMLVFLKNATLRAFEQNLRDPELTRSFRELYGQSMSDPVFTANSFRERLAKSDPATGAKVAQICQKFRPRIVYNMMESLDDTAVFHRIDRSLADILSIECDHFGLIPYDSEVRRSLKQPGLFLPRHLDSPTSQTIDRIAERVVRYWDDPIVGSAELLTNYARSVLGDQRANRA